MTEMWKGLMPWIIVCALVLVWGTGWFKALVNPIFTINYTVDGLHNLINKVPPVVAKPAAEGAIFSFTHLSYTGSGMLIAAIISAIVMGFFVWTVVKAYGETIWALRYSLITIAAMLAIGTLTRYSGIDATLGLAFAHAGFFYPFFGTLLGWLGVALTDWTPPPTSCSAACRRSPRSSWASLLHPDGRRQFLGRRDQQDDRCAIDRRCLDRHQLVRPRRLDLALRVQAFDCARLPGRLPRHAAGLRLHRHDRSSLEERGRCCPASDACVLFR